MAGVRDKSQGIAFQATGKAKPRILDQVKRTKVYKSFDDESLYGQSSNKSDEDKAIDAAELSGGLETIAADILRHLDNGIEPETVLLWASADLKKLVKG